MCYFTHGTIQVQSEPSPDMSLVNFAFYCVGIFQMNTIFCVGMRCSNLYSAAYKWAAARRARDKTRPLSTDSIEVQRAHSLCGSSSCAHCSQPSIACIIFLLALIHSDAICPHCALSSARRSRSLKRQRASDAAELDKLLVVSQSSECVYVQCTLVTHLAPGLAWHAVNKYCALHIQNEVGTFFTPVWCRRRAGESLCVSLYCSLLSAFSKFNKTFRALISAYISADRVIPVRLMWRFAWCYANGLETDGDGSRSWSINVEVHPYYKSKNDFVQERFCNEHFAAIHMPVV